MAYMRHGLADSDVPSCRYGTSRLVFRGPTRPLAGGHVVALGGSETFGRGVDWPWPAGLEARCGVPVVNMGAVGAGPDAWLGCETVLAACAGARAVVLQVPGAQALTNPFYRVHPRRNDRLVQALPPLHTLYPEVDFCEFTFTRHLLGALYRRDPGRFATLRAGLQATWSARMAALLARLPVPVVLLWLSAGPPPAASGRAPAGEPLLVDRPMIEALQPAPAALVVATVPAGREGLPRMPGAAVHTAAAEALAPVLLPLLGLGQTPPRRAAG